MAFRSLLSAVLLARAVVAGSYAVSATPHDSYSSSVGVLGCKINTDRVAYWPGSVDCNNLCVKLSYSGRSVYLLRIDQSGGAHDVSYDAWNYLVTGQSATKAPTAGGAIAMDAEDVDASKCSSLIRSSSKRLPLSASNSMNFLNSCLEQHAAGNTSWVAQNYVLYNILDPICTWGYDETCALDNWPSQNQATCSHTLGLTNALTTAPVYNILYPSGQRVLASSSASTTTTTTTSAAASAASSGTRLLRASWPGVVVAVAAGTLLSCLFDSL